VKTHDPCAAFGRILGGSMTRRALALLKRIAPYAVAALFLAWVLRKYSIVRIAEEMQRGDAIAVLPAAAAMIFVTWFLGASADFTVFAALHGKPGYRDVMRGRAASVILELFSHGAGKGGYGTWLVRRFGMRLPSTVGLMLYVMAAELCSMCIITFTSISLSGVTVPTAVKLGSATIATVLLSFMLLGPWKLVGDREWQAPWTRLPRRRALFSLGIRLVQHVVGLSSTIAAIRLFGLEIPTEVLLSLLPTIAVVGALPVTVGGVGAVQHAWLMLEPWAKPEAILAFSFLWGLAVGAMVVLRGLPFVGAIVAEIRDGQALLEAPR
jgi:hypothetical protein